MFEWISSLDSLAQIYLWVAIIATVILIIQLIATLMGFGFDIDSDFDVADIDGISFLTIRGIIAFFSIGGWAGLWFIESNLNTAVSIVASVVAGSLALIGVGYMLKASMKLQEDGTRDIQNAVGKSGKVYLTIPASRNGQGKVSLVLQGVAVEVEAITDDESSIKTNELVEVLSVVNHEIVLVKRK